MHILLIHQAFAALDEAGGTRHIEMAQQLARQGHRVTIIASPVSYLTGSAGSRPAWLTREEPFPGVTILRTYTLPSIHRSFVYRVFSFLSFMFSSFWVGLGVRGVDLIWGTSPPIFQGWTAWFLSRLKRVPFLFEIRDLWPAFAIAVGVLKNKTLIHLSEWLERFLYSHADRIIVNSPGFIQHVTSRGAWRVDLIANGADPAMFTPEARGTTFRSEFNLGDKFVVLYAGAHGLSNDLGIVLQAANHLCQRSDIVFAFVGAGKEKANLQQQASDMNLSNVVFAPPASKNQMAEVLAAADACIAILKPIEMYRTTYPNKVFDYMAAGRPVILAIDGVIRQVVEEAQAGIFVPPGDSFALASAVENLADNRQLAQSMGVSGRQAIETHYLRSLWTDQFMDIILAMHQARH